MVDPFDAFRSSEPRVPAWLARDLGLDPSTSLRNTKRVSSPNRRRGMRRTPRFHAADATAAIPLFEGSRRASADSRPGSRRPLPSLRGRCSRNREPREPSSSSCSKEKSRSSRVDRWLPREARVPRSARRPCSKAGRVPRRSSRRLRFPRWSPTSESSTSCSSRSPRSPSGFVPSRQNVGLPR